MDNVSHAMFLAFAMFALVLGLSFGIYLLGNMNSVAYTLIHSTDATSDYQTISYDSSNKENKFTRFVGVDTVISTLYRYYKENFSVEIYNNSKELVQVFDLTIENILAGSKDQNNPKEWDAYSELYGDNSQCNLFRAPWIVNDEYIKQRVDMYISGSSGYINGTFVDYSINNLKKLGNTFEEQFIQYTYDGQTISDNLGEDIESITGNVRAQNKIIIRYIQQ